MKQIILTVAVLFWANIAAAQNSGQQNAVSGCTVNRSPQENLICIGAAPDYQPRPGSSGLAKPAAVAGDWSLVDQVDYEGYLEAGRHVAVYFDHTGDSLCLVPPQFNNALTTAAQQAIEKAPQWLRNDLTWVFSNLTPEYQDLWAGGINDANDPYVDEVAFCVVHSSPQYLMSGYGSPDLFLDNAQTIYDHDQYLDYVQIVDYATTDGDYYSTIRYNTERDGEIIEQEAPKEIYYWYIVHPKITDEIPAYIDPDAVEDNSTHNNNIADPPTGKFWREFLFSSADEGYPVLMDSLAGCPILWDGTQVIDSDNNYAVEIITNWINETLVFDSDDERPHQPVRIYRKHKGRCGEYADFTAAAARAALIPCTSIFSYSTDHTWNEFWDQDWVQWEPVNNYIDRPLVYENGWGKVFGTVFEIRSDGYVTSVTDRYSEGTATINIHVSDANGEPVDGAEVWFYIKDFDYPIYWTDFYALTDNNGMVSVVVGDGRDFAARVNSDIGDYPEESNQVVQITSNTVDGETYEKSFQVSGSMPSLSWTQVDTPQAQQTHYRMDIDYTVPEQILFGNIWMDDVSDDSQTGKNVADGWIDFFMTDSANYRSYADGAAFDAFNISESSGDGTTSFFVPAGSRWYAVFANDRNLNNPQYVQATVSLYSDVVSAVASGKEQPAREYRLYANYPNPFNAATAIRYRLARAGKVRLSVYDAAGRLVRTLIDGAQEAGAHRVVWHAGDMASGIYYFRLTAGTFRAVRKCLLVK